MKLREKGKRTRVSIVETPVPARISSATMCATVVYLGISDRRTFGNDADAWSGC